MEKRNRLFFMMSAVLLLVSSACKGEEAKTDVSPDPSAVSPAIMEDARISYLGPRGTYTEEAAHAFFATGEFIPEDTVDTAIRDIAEGKADYAVIPQENSLGGAVTNYVDALIAEKDVYVVGEVILPISQTLMGITGASIEEIQTVCSHAQGITQSAEWRKTHMPSAVTKEMPSTAAAAGYVAETKDRTIAAIAAPVTAE